MKSTVNVLLHITGSSIRIGRLYIKPIRGDFYRSLRQRFNERVMKASLILILVIVLLSVSAILYQLLIKAGEATGSEAKRSAITSTYLHTRLRWLPF